MEKQDHKTSQASSNAEHSLAQVSAADSGYPEMATSSSVYARLSDPCAIAPIAMTMGVSAAAVDAAPSSGLGTSSLALTHRGALKEEQSFRQPGGKWSLTGFLITFKSF